MPRYLQAIYFGAAALAVVAFVLGFYEYVIQGDQDAHFGSDVFLPFAILVVVGALYVRRRREMERTGRKSDRHRRGNR